MGYESKVYLVKKSNLPDGWCSVLAMVNMSNMDFEFTSLFRYTFDGFFYADDGNTEVTEDKYGSPLGCAEVSEVIKYLENEIENGNDYWSLPILLGLLKSVEENNTDLGNGNFRHDNLRLVHYGY